MVVPEQWYEDNRVVRVHATATRVDADTHQVHLKEGGPVPFDRLLITTGGVNRTLEVPGADLPGVHQLRTVAESDAIKQDATRGARAVVVGMGFIGSEVAASLIQMGVQVTAVLPGTSPLESVLG
ncbi:MAG: NAD(P)/FAD-dependent oxidoreductase, partial [Chloroflexi bacterium]